ncbi:Predicted Zn-dependent peptidase [Filimonas lacunae]|uniref:Predicted Zn-dependent peptidase n=1 Tax=Filimonas lacunae TaxID=477680 RepID=A0A173MR54_9BACT|nr:insulinase family protein [Filimonas lacunae]BAV10155.1 insulinase-like:Peptidase M16, C-terminal precursor [Filimonas lacunae]SIT18765.1 Predicted Zn-dependent peptidase [Filimonas lacunae]
MKRIYFIIAGALLLTNIQAQTKIDRTKRPKAGPAPVITIGDPVTYQLANGITVLVVENHKLPKVAATYSIDAGPITEGAKAGVLSLMGGMLNEGTKQRNKAEFDEAVDQMGAEVELSASGGSASSLTRYFEKAFSLMAEGIQQPAFPQESFEKLKSQAITGLKSSERSVKEIAGRVAPALLYGVNHPSGEFETEATVSNLTLDDVKAAYQQYVTPSRGFLIFTGDIKPEQAKQLAEEAFGSWKGATLTLPKLVAVKNPAATEVDLVDVPNAVQSEIRVANLIELPLSNPDYFAVLLANQILGGGSDSYLFKNLREKHAFTYGAYSSVNAGRYQTSFSASASVRNEKTDSAVLEFLNEIKRIRTTKVDPEELKRAKALYNGSFALGMENTARIATYATNIILNNLPKDFYRTYLQKINAVTVEDIQRVAVKYFGTPSSRVIVVGKAAQVEAGLKKLGYTVRLYDKYAQPVTAKANSAEATFDAKKVVNDYLNTVGGVDELKKLKSMSQKMSLTMQGMTLVLETKSLAPNKSAVLVSMQGNVVDKQVFDGNNGYHEQMGQKQPMDKEDLADKKAHVYLVEQLDYLDNAAFKITAKGVESIAGKDAYKIEITTPAGKVQTEYYDVASKLLVKAENSAVMQGVTMNETVEVSNYKKVGAIMIPYKVVRTVEAGGQQQVMELAVTEVKVNEGVTEADFK